MGLGERKNGRRWKEEKRVARQWEKERKSGIVLIFSKDRVIKSIITH